MDEHLAPWQDASAEEDLLPRSAVLGCAVGASAPDVIPPAWAPLLLLLAALRARRARPR